MLIDQQAFKILEEGLTEEGKIEKFEKESGKILGSVMITLGEIPSNLKEEVLKEKNWKIYIYLTVLLTFMILYWVWLSIEKT